VAWAWPALLLLALSSGGAGAPRLVTSARPDDASVTIYRAPDRGYGMIEDNPAGFALVTERRTVTLPPGTAVIRFEGVAGNILPESALVSDLPRDVIEKNLDADLLSPRTLYDRMLGRRVLVRRTDRATGKTVEQQATIRSSADGAALVEFAGGIEALQCTGLSETILYPDVPAGLSAKPTLSVQTSSPRAVTATITLSYLAGGFDWQADYVLSMRRDGRGADMSAWITLASSDVTSFPNAHALVVAGRLNRVDRDQGFAPDEDHALTLHCYPSGAPRPIAAPPPIVAAPEGVMDSPMASEIVVTGVKRMAKQENLGDLKLYRFPRRVTVASHAQKQVAFLDRPGIPLRAVYVADVDGDTSDDPQLVLRVANRTAAGLGIPLPAGRVQIFETANGRPILIGSTTTTDKAIGEDLEYQVDSGPGVSVDVRDLPGRGERHMLVVTNANPWPIDFEARFTAPEDERLRFWQRLPRRDGRDIWSTKVPANGVARFFYEIIDIS